MVEWWNFELYGFEALAGLFGSVASIPFLFLIFVLNLLVLRDGFSEK